MTPETISNATVQPEDPEHVTFDGVYPDVRQRTEVGGGIGCLFALLWLAICILSFVILAKTDWPSQTYWLLWLSPFLVASLLTYGTANTWMDSRARRKAHALVEETNKRNIDAVNDEAISTAQSARWDYEHSLKLLVILRTDVSLAAAAISKARFEYSANAAILCWDYLLKTAAHIDAFKQHYKELISRAESYEQKLKYRVHTFPPFPIAPSMIPDIRKPVDDFDDTLRLGHTNDHFTRTWVLIEGFKMLKQELQNIPASINQSLLDMERRLEELIRAGSPKT